MNRKPAAPKAAPAAEADEVRATATALIQGAEELLRAAPKVEPEPPPPAAEPPPAAAVEQPLAANGQPTQPVEGQLVMPWEPAAPKATPAVTEAQKAVTEAQRVADAAASQPESEEQAAPVEPPPAPLTETVVQEQHVPDWHTAVTPQVAEILESGPLDGSLPFAALEQIALTRFKCSNGTKLSAVHMAWKMGEAFCAVWMSFANRKPGDDGDQDKYKNWTEWQDAHGLPRSTVHRSIHKPYKRYRYDQLTGKYLGELYAGREDEATPDPIPQGTVLQAQKGLDAYVNDVSRSLPAQSCVQIVANDDPRRPTVKILTGDCKDKLAQLPIEKINDRMKHIELDQVTEPPKPKSKPRETKPKGNGKAAPAAGMPKTPPPKVNISENKVYALSKEFPRQDGPPYPKGTYLGLAHRDRGEDGKLG